MKTIEQSIEIHASKEAIWNALTSDEGFADWSRAFGEGNWKEGDWTEGSEMRFIGTDKEGEQVGMACRIDEHRPGELIRARHFAIIHKGELVTEGDEFDEWIPAVEEYRLTGGPEVHVLSIKHEVPEMYLDMFTKSWSEALPAIKRISESA